MLSRVGIFFISFSQPSLDGRLWPVRSVMLEFLFPSSQPLSDGELWLAHSAVLVFIYLVHSPSCPQMASSGSRTPTHLFFSYYYSSPPTVDRRRALARTHSHVGSFFYFILRLCQLSIDSELRLTHKDTLIHFFILFFVSTSLHQPSIDSELRLAHIAVLVLFFIFFVSASCR